MDSPTPSVHTPCRRPNVSKSRAHHPEEKVRLMCSYGGRIVPRPHDKCLCYLGGDTRIIVVHRHSSLRELCLLLSGTLLLHSRPFILKYLLPGQDLDSLISIIHDEDLQLMIQEYDRVVTSSSPHKTSRLRLFLFFCNQPETAIPIRSHDAKQETRFVDAINDSRILSRFVLDASAVDRSAKPGGPPLNEYDHNLKALAVIQNNKKIKSLADVADISPSGSVSSSPSMFSLPSLGDDDNSSRLKRQQCQMEELNFATTDGCAVSSADLAPPLMVTTGHNMNGVTCDALASELTPSPLQLVRARASDALSFLSPNSVTRIASSCSYLSQPVHLQEQANMRSEISYASPPIQRDKFEESGYRLATQVDQNQEIEQFVQCVQQVALPCNYPVYAILPVVATHPTGASSGKPLLTLTPQIGTAASTIYNNATPIVNAASNPAFLQTAQFHQHDHVDFPQFHYCPLQSNLAFVPSPHGFEHQSTANVQKQTNTPLSPHDQSMTPKIVGALKHNIW